MDAAAITRLCETQRPSETENYHSPEKLARISGERNQSTGRKGAITDLGELSRKDDSWNHLERPRLPASIIFVSGAAVRERLFAAGPRKENLTEN